jgi:hypothetical protein
MKPFRVVMTSAAVAGLLTGSVEARATSIPNPAGVAIHSLSDQDKGKHACKGQNDCKGQGGCRSGDSACKGKNTCKGKGGCSTSKNNYKGQGGGNGKDSGKGEGSNG